MSPAHLEKSLSGVESSFDRVCAALVGDEPSELEVASTALRQTAIDFSDLMQGLSKADLKDRDLKFRLKRLAEGMAAQRISVIRRAVVVAQALNVIVPNTQDDSYASSCGPYGSLGKQSGAFKYLTA